MIEFTKLSILIPVYNEEATIEQVLDRIKAVRLDPPVQKELILVNDGSTDDTEKKIRQYMERYPDMDIRYLKHEKNKGKGASIQTGLPLVTGTFSVIQDADLEYDPEDYLHLLKPVLKGHADVVYGSRFMGGKPHRVLFFWHYVGNKLLTMFSNLFTNLNLTDMETGYKLFRTSVIKNIRLHEPRFGFEPEITAKIARLPGIRIYEVGISYYGRTYREGKKIKWTDGFRAIYFILKYNLFSK